MSIIITTTAPAKPVTNQSTVEQENVSAGRDRRAR
jgi:hypothetical protein